MGRKTVPSLQVCKASSAEGLSLFPLLSHNCLQKLVTLSHPGILGAFVVVGKTPPLILPGEPNNHHRSLTSLTLMPSLYTSPLLPSTYSAPQPHLSALLMPRLSPERIHTGLLGCLKQEAAAVLHFATQWKTAFIRH